MSFQLRSGHKNHGSNPRTRPPWHQLSSPLDGTTFGMDYMICNVMQVVWMVCKKAPCVTRWGSPGRRKNIQGLMLSLWDIIADEWAHMAHCRCFDQRKLWDKCGQQEGWQGHQIQGTLSAWDHWVQLSPEDFNTHGHFGQKCKGISKFYFKPEAVLELKGKHRRMFFLC